MYYLYSIYLLQLEKNRRNDFSLFSRQAELANDSFNKAKCKYKKYQKSEVWLTTREQDTSSSKIVISSWDMMMY